MEWTEIEAEGISCVLRMLRSKIAFFMIQCYPV